MNSIMTSQAASEREAERVHVDHGVTKRLGRWTSASQFDVRVRSGVLVLDLRSPEVTGDVEVRLGLHRSTVKLLLAEDDQVGHWELDWTGRGQVKDDQRPAGPGGRRIRLSGRTAVAWPPCRPCSPARSSRTCARPARTAATRPWMTPRGQLADSAPARGSAPGPVGPGTPQRSLGEC
jgi:hypothetical protein